MRILAMLHDYVPHHNAGAEVMAHSLLRAMVERGHRVDVLLSEDKDIYPGPYTIDGVSVYTHQDKSDPFRWFESDEHCPDLVVTHLFNTYRASLLARKFDVPLVHVQHNELLESRLAMVVTPPDLVVYNTHWMQDEFESWWQDSSLNSAPRSLVVHPPVFPGEYEPVTGASITLVNLLPKKGSEIFYALADRFPNRDFLGVEGGYGEQDVRELDNVTVAEHVAPEDMRAAVYAKTKVLLVPSSYESYGLVAAEAVCAGIPVIAHPTPGLRECLGDAGIFCDRDDVQAWESALKKLLTPRGWSAASKRSLKRATELDPSEELARWCAAAEGMQRGPSRVV